ncbi:MAG: hypothetical protein ACI4JC_08060 [Faecalibacterium sp.]
MKQQIFRKKIIDQLSSPEQLTDYIRVSSPAMWVILSGIILLLLGACVWGVFGRLDTTLQTAAVSSSEELVILIREEDLEKLRPGMTVTVNGNEHAILETTARMMQVAPDSLEAHYGSFEDGQWVCLAVLDGIEPEGIYSASILIESIAPMKFALN